LYIPAVHENGKFEPGLFFCTSDFVEGQTARMQYKKNNYDSFPLQFDILEKVSKISLPENFDGYGEWSVSGKSSFASFEDFVKNVYQTNNIFNWEQLQEKPLYDEKFTKYLISKIEEYLPLMNDEKVLVHGDFGNDNFFINEEGECSGLIDWNRSMIGNHFLDVGRIVLYCPDKKVSSQAALDFYKDKEHKECRKKILFGVYYTMLNNYAGAVREDMRASCESSAGRIKKIESFFEKNSK